MSNEHTSQKEFIFLVALLTALVAMSIDTMLPALGTMASEFGVSDPNKRQYIIGSFFAGMTIGTLVSGPISDSTGRKPAIFAGLLIYLAGSVLCLFSTSFEMLLAGRALQGVGAASPRIVSMAMVRDGQGGAAMARIMSFVMSVFMLVPILAPSIGQLVLFVASWRMIFVGFLAMAIIAAIFLQIRQEETLATEKRVAFSAGNLFRSATEFFRFPMAWGYTISVGFVFASFICYLGTSQQIFAEQYAQGEWFAVWFGGFAVAIAFAMIFNGRMVMRHGMRLLSKWAVRGCIVLSAIFLAVALAYAGQPPLWTLGLYLFGTFFCCGILFGNYNAMAMEPVGHIAGMAAAISGTLSTLVALSLGTWFGQQYDGTVMPLVYAFLSMSVAALLVSEGVEWAKQREVKNPRLVD
ncbi:MAG: multidrug effflux MFS transporter [Aestuariivirga sp.]|nr:multidrug effflux MFS transporter [Aestuariivirga sp.]